MADQPSSFREYLFLTCYNMSLNSEKCILCRGNERAALDADISFRELIYDPKSPVLYPYPYFYSALGLRMHPRCHDLLMETFAPSDQPGEKGLKRLAVALKYLYIPRDWELETLAVRQALLSPRVRDVLHDTCNQTLFVRLPAEIQVMIARFTGPVWYLTVLAEIRPLFEEVRRAPPHPRHLSLTHPVYVTRIEYQGHSYLSGIRGKGSRKRINNRQQRINLPHRVEKVVISADHVGVRGVQFLDRTSTPTLDGSPWYKTIEVADLDSRLTIRHDGIFVRNMSLMEDESSFGNTLWAAPDPPKLDLRNIRDYRTSSRLECIHITPDVKGLLVCCADWGIQGIYDCTALSRPSRRIVDITERDIPSNLLFWTYFPINSRETMEDAWVNESRGHYGPSCLMLRTSLGRSVLFGPEHSSISPGTHAYRSLRHKGDGPILGIVHDGEPNPGPYPTLVIGLVCDSSRAAKGPEPDPPWPRYTTPEPGKASDGSAVAWFITKARLDDLHHVRVSRDSTKSHNPCIGMLLCYKDGHMESVGRVHWNLEMERDIRTPVAILTDVCDGAKYVKDIVPCSPRSLLLNALPDHGTIVWWFSTYGDEDQPITDFVTSPHNHLGQYPGNCPLRIFQIDDAEHHQPVACGNHLGLHNIAAGFYIHPVVQQWPLFWSNVCRLLLPFAIGGSGWARMSNGQPFGITDSDYLDKYPEPRDSHGDLYQNGTINGITNSDMVQIDKVLNNWADRVERADWVVDEDGVVGGINKFREADTEAHWQKYWIPLSW